MVFRLVPKSTTFNDLEWNIGRYLLECGPTKSHPEPPGAVRTPPGAARSRPDTALTLPGAVRTLSVGLRRPEPYNDRRINRENARESGCS